MKASELIAVALAEIGYVGKKTNDQLDDPAANPGGKYTKYARDLNIAGYYNGNKNGYDYCTVFCDWCFFKTANCDKTAAMLVKPVSIYGASVGYIKCMFPPERIGKGIDAMPGDQLVFNNGTPGKLLHTGLVKTVDRKTMTLTTIEGNITDDHCVGVRTYSLTDPKIDFLVHPYYEEDYIKISTTEYKQLKEEAVAFRTIRSLINGNIS